MDLPYKLWAEYATLSLTMTSIHHSTDSNFVHSALAKTIAVNFVKWSLTCSDHVKQISIQTK